MKLNRTLSSTLVATALLLPLSLWADPSDQTASHHDEKSDMLHERHDEHPMHESSEHHSMSEKHHSNAPEIYDDKNMKKQGASDQHMMDHSQHHSDHDKSSMMPADSGSLQQLQKLPPSGSSREAGYDDRYAMESTSASNSLQTQCAQASRGLVMVDNATWAKCGGKPEGWSEGIGEASTMDHSEHMGH